jgi:hypothetical protein
MSASQGKVLQAEPIQETSHEVLETAEHARRRYEQLNRKQTRFLNDSCDPALSFPDRALSLTQSFQTHRAAKQAFDAYKLAQRRFRELTLCGTLPVD